MSNQPAECSAEYHYDELRSYSQYHIASVPFRLCFLIQNDYLHIIHSHTLGNFNFVSSSANGYSSEIIIIIYYIYLNFQQRGSYYYYYYYYYYFIIIIIAKLYKRV